MEKSIMYSNGERRRWEMEYWCSNSNQQKESRLGKWYIGTSEQIAEAKRGYIHVDRVEEILLSVGIGQRQTCL